MPAGSKQRHAGKAARGQRGARGERQGHVSAHGQHTGQRAPRTRALSPRTDRPQPHPRTEHRPSAAAPGPPTGQQVRGPAGIHARTRTHAGALPHRPRSAPVAARTMKAWRRGLTPPPPPLIILLWLQEPRYFFYKKIWGHEPERAESSQRAVSVCQEATRASRCGRAYRGACLRGCTQGPGRTGCARLACARVCSARRTMLVDRAARAGSPRMRRGRGGRQSGS